MHTHWSHKRLLVAYIKMIKMLINFYVNLSAGVCIWFKETCFLHKLLLHSHKGFVNINKDNGLK